MSDTPVSAPNDSIEQIAAEIVKKWLMTPERMTHDLLTAAITAALRAQREAGPWRDIATAPQDGTTVLAVDETHSRTPRVLCATLSKHGEWLSVPGKYSFHATRWMPLPPIEQREAGRAEAQQATCEKHGIKTGRYCETCTREMASTVLAESLTELAIEDQLRLQLAEAQQQIAALTAAVRCALEELRQFMPTTASETIGKLEAALGRAETEEER